MTNHVDLAFAVRGSTLPRDHGYALYGALSRYLPLIHDTNELGIHGIAGKRLDAEQLSVEARGVLRIRVPQDQIPTLLPLIGTTIEVAGHAIEIGPPTVHPLVPAATLDARLVVIRLTGGIPKPFDPVVFEKRFVADAQRQLVAIGIRGELELCGRQSLRVRGQRVIGYSIRVLGLTPDDSLKLQSCGIGGKRTMGCGIFRPARIREKAKQVA